MATPRGLLDELRAVGTELDDIWALVNIRDRYPRAIPVLLAWLENLDERGVPTYELPRLREGIVRALTVREARPGAATLLVKELRGAVARGQSALAWATSNALGVVADDSCYDDGVELAQDSTLGSARQMLLSDVLARTTKPEATIVLLGLLDDRDVNGHAIAGLAKRRDERARAAFERFVNDDRAWVRREAKKGLARLDR